MTELACAGCKKDMSEPQGNFKMRFVGRKDGKLIHGAPGNYIQGKVYQMPFRHSKFKWWELLEKIPEFTVPESSPIDSVYEEAVFVPWEEDATELEEDDYIEPVESEIALSAPTEIDLDSHTREIAESYKKQGMFLLDADKGVVIQPDEPVETDPRSRDELKAILDAAGVAYSKKAWTETLARMVQELESEEDS